MAEHSTIEWTDATLFGAPLPKRCSECRLLKAASDFGTDRSRHEGIGFVCLACRYARPADSAPGTHERRLRASQGQRWCRHCSAWLPTPQVGKNGLCRAGEAAEARDRYGTDAAHRARRKQHATSRRRGIAPIPLIGMQCIGEEFDGRCAYCPAPATAWDHVVPVARGGETRPHNIVPACRRCNSSKRTQDVWTWLARTGRTPHERLYDRLDLEDIHGR